MRAFTIVVGVALLAFAAARCPNACSGHGDCFASDKCTCWDNWQGYDCSERTCEFDIAWATDYRQNPHYYAECSAAGICDRSTGLCACFDGFTGSACRRTVCPNDCSGHGKCRLVVELEDATMAQSAVVDTETTVGSYFAYADWDGDKIQACVCDGGFFGPDCSQRYCPKGDDPLTTCAETSGSSVDLHQVQTLTLSSKADTNRLSQAGGNQGFFGTTPASDLVGELVLHFTDNHGEVWTTSNILISDGTNAKSVAADNIEAALALLPNFKIPSIAVTAMATTNGATTSSQVFDITFNDERTSGEQTLLSCDPLPLGCQTGGCSPMYRQLKSWTSGAFTSPNWVASAGYAATFHDVTTPANDATPPAAWDSGADLAATMDAFITTDSVLDNAALSDDHSAVTDQATVKVHLHKAVHTADSSTWGAASDTNGNRHSVYATYSVCWDLTTGGLASAFGAGCTTPRSVPTGYDTAATVAAGFPSDAAVGYNHIPIGYGIYINLPDALGGLTDDAQEQTVDIVMNLATVRCAVTQTVRSDVMFEDLECSGRGTCDHSVGTCTCFEGHYGDHCGLQTILV